MVSKILVTGANGQLGNEFKFLASNSNHEFFFVDINELDLTNEKEVEGFFGNNKFDFVINCAAYTAVDKAETEKETAYKVNVNATSYIANASLKNGFKLIHISTDFVFDGNKNTPYIETDYTNPINYYGETKLLGEKAISEKIESGLIIRTSWLYSQYGNNFVKTILRLTATRDEINIVFDQVGTPTYALDLAKSILIIIEQQPELSGIFHYSNEGVASWYDFAFQILQNKKLTLKLNPIETKDYPIPARRPNYSVLNKTKIKNFAAVKIKHWVDSLNECLNEITL